MFICFQEIFYRWLLFCYKLMVDIKFAFSEQVRVCREKTTGHVYAMKKLKKSEMLRRGQVNVYLAWSMIYISEA